MTQDQQLLITSVGLTGEILLDSGSRIEVILSAPYHYGDALRDKIVSKVLVPQNQEDVGGFLSTRQAYHRGMPIS